MNQIKKLFWLSLIVKLVLAAALPLSNDEAYYWVWSQHMQLSYYDHPPFVAWLFWLGNFMSWTAGSIRWPGVLLAHASLAIWLKLLTPFLNSEQRLLWLALALLSPLVGGSGLIVTPDVPLMFFYASSLLLFFKWIQNPSTRMALLFGVSMGLGFSSKYMMVLFAFSLLPVVIMQRTVRQSLWRSLPWLVIGGLVGSLPVWLWNFMHDFASWKFQANHGLGSAVWKPKWTLDYILIQIGLIFPPILYWAVKSRRMLILFHFLAWIPLAFFLFTTFRGYVEANWPIVAYPPLFALAVSHYPVNRSSLKITLGIWASLLITLAVAIFIRPSWTSKIKLREFHQFDSVIEMVKSRNPSPLFVRSYQMAAKMSFELNRPIYKLRGMGGRIDFYDFLPESEPSTQFYYLVALRREEFPAEILNRGDHVIEAVPIDDVYELLKMETSKP